MERIKLLQQDAAFTALLDAIERAEADRIYCRHGLSHMLDTARIAWIMALEDGIRLKKDVVYAAALLHDLGRAKQHSVQEDHDTAALADCECMLRRAGFADDETGAILEAIRDHGDKTTPDSALPALSMLLRRADNLSRNCWHCSAAGECYWPRERRNHHISM